MAHTQTLHTEGPSNSGWRRGRIIRRVPLVLLTEKRNHQDYIPKVVSIGPYHHGKPELGFAESFKSLAMTEIFRGSDQLDMCLQVIKEEITEIRNCYEEGSTDGYDDDQLSRMMLLDACFITVHIAIVTRPSKFDNDPGWIIALMRLNFGLLSISIALRDMCLADNQIPFWIVELLVTVYYTQENPEKVLDRYLTTFLFGEFYSAKITLQRLGANALHLLEHLYRALANDIHKSKETRSSHVNCCVRVKERTNADLESGECCCGISRFQFYLKKLRTRVCKYRLFKKAEGDLNIAGHSFRSLTELKAKGIHLRPSPTQSLRDVEFKSNFMYAELQLPTWSGYPDTKTLFLNMMSYELDPSSLSDGIMVSYINLMKSLIVKSEDVKELREKKILLDFRRSDEEIVKMYQDLNTHGANNSGIYKKVRDGIQAHCNSKANTWMAELVHTYFRSPWAFITLLAATLLLVLILSRPFIQ